MKIIVNFFTVAICVLLTLNLPVTNSTAFASTKTVRLGGQPFGVKFYNDGLIVIDLEEFFDGSRYVCPAKESGLKVNDIIKEVNQKQVNTNEDLQSATMNSGGKPVNFTVERNKERKNIIVNPVKSTAGIYLLGAWVRDSCAGIGTISYYDENNKTFGALGHGICDNDTTALLPLGSAEIVKANISSVTKSINGNAGSLNGYFSENSIGTLTKNTPMGVYGTAENEMFYNRPVVEVAEFSEIKTGEAEVYTTIKGETENCYSAEITKICNSRENSNENFVIKITDKSLLDSCGGIVQGMSGSPIVQNGKLIGAVTHVFVNNTTEGYGVSAQFMVSNYEH